MEFFEEEARPRLVLQSRSASSSYPSEADRSPPAASKLSLLISVSVSLILFSLSIFYLQSEPSRSLLLWLSISLLVGPFAPSPLTGGHIRVGHGPIVESDPEPNGTDSEPKKKFVNKRSRAHKSEPPHESTVLGKISNELLRKEDRSENAAINKDEPLIKGIQNGNPRVGDDATKVNGEEKNWSEDDIEILKKQIAKKPAGKPGRWEAIAGSFNGRHKVESVIKKAKELGEKKTSGDDDYTQFLKNRKQSDGRLVEDQSEDLKDSGVALWTSGEDIALLNALKAFPKEVPMRWEKIALAVPGKSKATCVKRVAELKKGFRSSKAGAGS